MKGKEMHGLLEDYADVVSEQAGCVNNITTKVLIKTNNKLKFSQACQISYAIKENVGDQLNRLKKAGIISAVTTAEWAMIFSKFDVHKAYLHLSVDP